MAHKSLTKAIAKELAKGRICYIHKESLKIITLPDLVQGEQEPPERKRQSEKLEKNIRKYYKVPTMSKKEELHIREDFIKEDLSTSIRKELTNSLKRANPTRNFMQIIEADEGLTMYWVNFKRAWYQEWVRGYLLDIYRF